MHHSFHCNPSSTHHTFGNLSIVTGSTSILNMTQGKLSKIVKMAVAVVVMTMVCGRCKYKIGRII